MPYMRKQAPAQIPLLRQIPSRYAARGMGQDDSSSNDQGIDVGYGGSVAPQPIVTNPVSLPVGGLSTTDISDLGLSPTAAFSPVSTTTPSSSGLNLGNLFSSLANAAVAGQKIYLSTQTPALIPGTNAIYNPSTGQYYNPTTGQVVNPSGLSTAGIPQLDLSALSGYLPIILLAVAGVVVFSMVEHH